MDPPSQFLLLVGFRRVFLSGGYSCQLLGGILLAHQLSGVPLQAANPVHAEVVGDGVEPGREPGLSSEATDRSPGPKKHVLRDLRGKLVIPQRPQAEVEYEALVSLHQLPEGSRISQGSPFRQLLVGKRLKHVTNTHRGSFPISGPFRLLRQSEASSGFGPSAKHSCPFIVTLYSGRSSLRRPLRRARRAPGWRGCRGDVHRKDLMAPTRGTDAPQQRALERRTGMNGRQLIIGILAALMVLVAVAIAASIVAIFLLAPVRSEAPLQSILPKEVQMPDVLISLGTRPYTDEETEVRTVPASTPSRLRLENRVGNAVIKGASVQEVQVRATRRGRGSTLEEAASNLRQLEVAVTRQQDGIVITAGSANETSERSYLGSVDLEVTVPTDTHLTLQAGVGNLQLSDLRGSLTIVSGIGNVEASGVEGDLDIAADMGNVEIRNSRIASSLRLNGRMGQIHLQGQLPDQGIGEIVAKMGNVVVQLPASSTAGIEASTKMGKIRSDFPGESSSEGATNLAGSQFKVPARGGGFRLFIQNEMGNVELRAED